MTVADRNTDDKSFKLKQSLSKWMFSFIKVFLKRSSEHLVDLTHWLSKKLRPSLQPLFWYILTTFLREKPRDTGRTADSTWFRSLLCKHRYVSKWFYFTFSSNFTKWFHSLISCQKFKTCTELQRKTCTAHAKKLAYAFPFHEHLQHLFMKI